MRASNFIPKDRLATTDDCGLAASWIADERGHRSYEHRYEIAFQKIANRVEGTRRAAEILGVG